MIFFFIIVALGIALRLPRLSERPMHTDEAVQAIKFGFLLENNDYRYDPIEYHGPTLNYFTLISAWLSSATKLTEVTESNLRSIPLFFGMMLILALFLLKDTLNRVFILFAALFTAMAPAMVFYSRYYIHEMLLVFFTFCVFVSALRYSKTRHIVWVLFTGISIGLMHATKETNIIAFAAMLFAWVLTLITNARTKSIFFNSIRRLNPWHILIGATSALFISALLHSSFMSNPRGILDSFLTYWNYLDRGAGHQEWHIHPWHYYFKLLIGSKYPGRPMWSEMIIILLAGIGMVTALHRSHQQERDKGFLRFIVFYSIIMTIIYSAIPYKTPWSMLGFYHGWLLCAAIGAVSILRIKPYRWLRWTGIFIMTAGLAHLLFQTYLLNNQYEDDPSNPYVYAHTVKDIFIVTEKIDAIAEIYPDGKNIYIEVICPGADYWPLPWYLRDYPNVGWWSQVDFNTPSAPVIIAMPSVESDLVKKLYQLPPPGQKSLYLPLFDAYTELRPMVEIRGYIKKELWDLYMRSRNP
ncbi:TIGR03663 family protein [bacterium]|nr:TIGR03663 family protein [bacterium]